MRLKSLAGGHGRRPFLAGFSIAELMMALTVFSMLVVISVAFLSGSQRVWGRINASASAGETLRKSAYWVSRDLINGGKQGFASTSNGADTGRMGEALWMLSAEDPASGAFVRGPGGGPFWQKNILFYLTVPLDHDQRYGVACQAFDRVCPHKVLLRKVIDTGTPTTPASSADAIETLLTETEILPYLTRPAGLDLTGLEAEPGVVDVRYLAGGLLDSQVTLEQEGAMTVEASLVLEAPMLEEFSKRLVVGQDEFEPNTFTLSRRIAVVPIN